MLNEDDDIARLIINSIQKDLVSRNELWQCLALSIIGNLGGREMAETLHNIIEKLVVTAYVDLILNHVCNFNICFVFPSFLHTLFFSYPFLVQRLSARAQACRHCPASPVPQVP